MNLFDLQFRQMQPEDYDDLVKLWIDAGLPYRSNGRDKRGKMLRELKNSNEALFLAFRKERLLGAILASHDGRKGWINRLAVHPDFRKQGLAKILIEKAENFLYEQGIEIIACLIEDWNSQSMQLFTKVGYKRFDDIIYFTKKKHPGV
ncbi:MAG: GNAT family N-acetyltransferase [Candidatus Cloacimonadales bacterium]|nr:GNAT family N-acetyltransferase [Candidatus Cloacimonadales bacterium]